MAASVQLPARMAHWTVLLVSLLALAAGFAVPHINVQFNAKPGTVITELQNHGQRFEQDEASQKYFKVTDQGVLVTRRPLTGLLESSLVVSITHKTDSHSWTEPISVRVVNNGRDSRLHFADSSYEGYLTEGNAPGERVLGLADLKASMPVYAEGMPVTYSLHGPGSQSFYLVVPERDQPVQVFAIDTLDAASADSYQLTLQAVVNGEVAQTTLKVAVLGLHPPAFMLDQFVFSIREEDTKPGRPVGSVYATDEDQGENGHVTYHLDKPSPYFTIDRETGDINLAAKLQAGDYQIRVVAQDTGTPPSESTPATVLVTVFPSTSNKIPYGDDMLFPRPKGNVETAELRRRRQAMPVVAVALPEVTLSFREDTAVGTVIFTVANVNASDRFALTEPANPLFAVGETTGEVSLVSPMDHEESDTQVFEVEITNLDDPAKLDTQRVVVTVDDVDEPPQWEMIVVPYIEVVPVDAPSGASIYELRASDPEGTPVHYYLRSGGDGKFTVDEDSGWIQTTFGQTYVEGEQYVLSVYAQDGNGSEANAQVTIFGGSHPPQFTQEVYQASVTEEVNANQQVIKVQAFSFDNLAVTYSLVAGANVDPRIPSHTIDATTGVITLTEKVDREVLSAYYLDVQATEDTEGGMSVTTRVNVDVEDVNDCNPFFERATYTFRDVSEDISMDTPIATVVASDCDDFPNNVLTYSLSGPDADKFRLTPEGGVLYPAAMLDYDSGQPFYELEAMARDEAGGLDTASLWVFLSNINDEAPVFLNTDGMQYFIDEDAENGYKVGTVYASDADPDSTITFGIQQSSTFQIDPDTGVILRQGSGNLPEANYRFNVTATDGTYTTYAEVNIEVNDINDNTPQFPDCATYAPHIPENATENTFVLQVTATDADKGTNAEITYDIPGANIPFEIDRVTGEIFTRDLLDRETTPAVDIVVSAKDNPKVVQGNTGFCRFTITITDVNDNYPQFLLDDYRANVNYSTAQLDVVLNVTAEDADLNSRIAYSLIPADHNDFGINQFGGVYARHSLTNNAGETFEFKVKADDSQHSREIQVIIYVTTNLDAPPTWTELADSVLTIPENAPIGTPLITVSAQGSGQIGYRVEHGQVPETNSKRQFTIFSTGTEGRVQTSNLLDYETTKNYQLALRAFNDNNHQQTYQTLTVEVEDVNDETPQFPLDAIFTSVTEEERDVNMAITTVTAVDGDTKEDFKRVQYYLDPQYGDWANFSIDPVTGQIFSPDKFDHETKEAYAIQIIAKDSAPSSFPALGGQPNVAYLRVTINIVDINDNSPTFQETIYTVNIPENAAVGSEVIQVQAQDRDSDSIRYLITANNTGGAFDVNPESGQISIASPLDYEAQSEYWLQYTANDGLNFATVPVRVRLVNVNDEVPVFGQSLYQLDVDEEDDTNLPRDLVQVTAQDGDAGADQASIRFSLEGDGAGNEFTVDPVTGQIRLNRKLDREERSHWNFLVKATDDGGAGLTGYADVEVTVNDINDNAPYFPNVEYRGSVPENSPAGTPVLEVEAVDLDDPLTNGRITYEVVSGSGIDNDGAALFEVDPNSGQVTVKTGAQLDHEAMDSYNLKIRASDDAGSYADTDVVIQILDENDNRPSFEGGPFTVAVPETLPLGATVYEVPASDADSDFNDLVQFSIQGGDASGKFEIVADPISLVGIVRIADPLDFETGPAMYTLTLGVRDNSDPWDTTTLTVTVQDVNDMAPIFLPTSDYVANVLENVAVGTLIHTVTARDVEAGDAGLFTFEIDPSTDPDGQFVISAPNGSGATRTAEVRTLKPLDRETVEVHSLTLRATDQGVPPLSGTATLTLTLDDVNDTPPRFAKDYKPKIRENFAEIQFVVTVSAVDDDATGGGPFSFEVVPNADTDSFTSELLGANQFSIETKPVSFDREQQAFYTIPIRITETSPNGNSGISNLVVEVEDENDNPHTGISKDMLVYSFEGMIPDSPIGYVGVSDPDTIEDKTYTPLNNFPAEYFTLDSDTGLVTILAGTPAGMYTFEVQVQDDGSFPDQVSEVTVDVRDLPEEAVRSSGSFRFQGVTAEELIAVPADGSSSKLDLLLDILVDIIPAKPENIDIFSVINVAGTTDQVDVRYSAHGSPFYPPEKMDGAALEHRDRIEKELGVTIGMVKIDMCLQESACESACTNVLEIDPQPTVVNTPGASFTSITTRTVAHCVCGAQQEAPGPCDFDACLNGGTCTETQGGAHTCACPTGFDGPDCQQTTREFKGGFAHFGTLQQCEVTHTTLEFITTNTGGLLLYNGPMTPPATADTPEDLLLLQLDDGKPQLHINLGSGLLSLTIPTNANLGDGKWHRLDVYRNGQEVDFILDRCKDATIAEASSSTDRQTTGCKVNGTTPGGNKFLNVNTPLQLGGRDESSAFTYPDGVPFASSFTGCMKNVEQDGKLYDLQVPGKAVNSDPGCSQLKCGECNSGKCVGDFSTYTCLCDPGFTGALCDKETPAYDFATDSFVTYRLTDQVQLNSREGNYQVTFRTREKEGLLLTITNANGLEFTTVELINGFVRSRWNLGDGEHSVYLDSYAVDDGDWHTVHFERFDFYVTVRVDSGGGTRQAQSSASTFSTLEADPNSLLLGAFVVRVVEISQDFQGCMNDPRINNFYLGFEGQSVYGTAQPSDGVSEGCPSFDPCLSNPCPAPFICIDLWRKYTCGCADGFYEADGQCLNVNDCDPNPCLNGGKCQDLVNGFQCTCTGSYKGDTCETLVEPYVAPPLGLSVGAFIAMILCLLLIIMMLLMFVVYKRSQDRKQALAFALDPDDDIRENFINYDEEGGGEEDQDSYDVNKLRMPVHPTPVDETIKPPTTEAPQHRAPRPRDDDPNMGDLLNDRLKDADDDPDANPNDSLHEFDYEGEGSSAGTLSSLNSSSTDGDQNYDYLNDWGPPFKKLADMYGGGEDD